MKKNYFMGTLLSLLMLVALPAKAATISDLCGKWKFTADMEVTTAGQSLTDYFSNDCEVTIVESDGNYDAFIYGFAGLTAENGKHSISDFTDNKLTVPNWNLFSGAWDGGLWMTTVDGANPWATTLPSLEMTYDPATKTISIPDFSLITIADYTDAKGTIVATFKNAKLTLVEGVEEVKVEWEGTYKVKSTVSPESEACPAEFDMVIAYSENAGGYVIRNFMGYDVTSLGSIKLVATDDANVMQIPALAIVAMIEPGVTYYKLKDMNAQANNITMTKNEDGSISIKDFTVFSGAYDSTDGDSYVAWYQNVTASLEGEEEETTFDWPGTYTVTATVSPESEACPATFDMEIAYSEAAGCYVIRSFMGYDVTPFGSIKLIETENKNQLKITALSTVAMIEPGVTYYNLFDANAQPGPITMTLNEDGSISIKDFTVFAGAYGTAGASDEYIAWYQNVKAVRKDMTSIEAVGESTAKVTVDGNVISIEGEAQHVVVYDVVGRVEFSGVASTVANLGKGVHLVKVGNSAAVKVYVK